MRKISYKDMESFFHLFSPSRRAGAIRLATRIWKMANSPAGLLLLGSMSAFILIPRVGLALNPVEEYQLGYGIVSFTMKAPAKNANLYHLYVPATGATEITEIPRRWSAWTKTGIFLREKDCFMIKATGSVHTSLRRLRHEIDRPAIAAIQSPKYVGPNGTTEMEETPNQRYLRRYRIYVGGDVGFGGLVYRIESKEKGATKPMPAGKGERQRLEAPQSGELQFAINDISLEGKSNNEVQKMYLPDPSPAAPCKLEEVLNGSAGLYCVEAYYDLAKDDSKIDFQKPEIDARSGYETKKRKWMDLIKIAKDKFKADTNASGLEVSMLVPDLWYKDNIGGHTVTVMTSTHSGECPKP